MLCQVLGAPQIGISELVNPQHVACWMTTKSSANSASAASMKCAGTGICDNVDAQKESSGIQGKKKSPWSLKRPIYEASSESLREYRVAEFCAYRREGHCCFEILPIYWFLLASKGLRATGTQDYEQYGSRIFSKSRGEIAANTDHLILDKILWWSGEPVLPCTFETWIHSVPYISLSFGHRVIFGARVTLRH